MSAIYSRQLDHVLFGLYALFVFASTFSIALTQMALGLSLAVFIAVVIRDRFNPFAGKLRLLYAALAVYVAWMILASVAGENAGRSLWVVRDAWLFGALPIGVYLFQNADYRRWMLTFFAAGVVLISLYGIFQAVTGINLFKSVPLNASPDWGFAARGNFPHVLTYGNYVATAGAFLLAYGAAMERRRSGASKSLFLIAGLVAAAATLLSYSRGPIGALLLAVVVAGVLLGRRAALITVVTLVAGAVTAALVMPGLVARYTGEATSRDMGGKYEGGRVFIWNKCRDIIQEHPVFGVGPANFESAYEQQLRADLGETRRQGHAHNDLIHAAVVSGLPGALLFAAMWLVVLGYLWVGWRRGGVAPSREYAFAAFIGSLAFALSSVTEASFWDEEVREMLMFVWAAGLWPLYNVRRGSCENRA